jgi:hypothetical protein
MVGAPNGQHRAVRAIFALAVAVACLGSVAYAASRPDHARPHGEKKKQGKKKQQAQGQDKRPPRPRFIEVPAAGGVEPDTQFRFHVAPRPSVPGRPGADQAAPPAPRWRQFECRLDGGAWEDCSSPRRLTALAPGEHSFAVRALNRRGQSGPAAHYRWAQAQPPQPAESVTFSIELIGSLAPLMPGDPPQQLPLRISNPNSVPIEVTSLAVGVAPDAPGCPGDPNFAVTPSSLSPAAPLSVPAGGSVELPTAEATAPTLALRELPFDQNACQGTTVQLHFSGEARG